MIELAKKARTKIASMTTKCSCSSLAEKVGPSPAVRSAVTTAGSWPKAVKMARIISTVVEARKLIEPIKLPERMASSGDSRLAMLATQRRRCMLMITESDGRRRSISGMP